MQLTSIPTSAKLPDSALWEPFAAAITEAQAGSWVSSMEPFFERVDAGDGMRVCCEVDESRHPSTHPIGIWRQSTGYTTARVNMGKLRPEDSRLAAALHQHPWPSRARTAFSEKGKVEDSDWTDDGQAAQQLHFSAGAVPISPNFENLEPALLESNATSPEPVLLHHWVCWLAHGPPPRQGMHASHFVCNNPKCMRATHIRWQDPSRNVHDGKYSSVCVKMKYSNGYVRAYSKVKRPILQ